ncbi:MAG: Maf family nucleotide pyrophosphatase [Pseudomonadota bacterium]|nr:Maf family nucleotide pyrophosphatase [Pseudomonadota bacterium]
MILASSSRYRRELLQRLGVPFESWSPEVDEAAMPSEPPRETAIRLARNKAEAGARKFPSAWIIGSDQVADLDGRAIGKPGTFERARQQLRDVSGHSVLFHTALCVWNARLERRHERLVTTDVAFRRLTDAEIERYLEREHALDCAGSAKSEGLGISLLSRLGGEDPTALVGLPLIALASMLRAEGFDVP